MFLYLAFASCPLLLKNFCLIHKFNSIPLLPCWTFVFGCPFYSLFIIIQNLAEAAIHSISLLRERFRQLQRAKEIRQERELLQLFSESERLNLTNEPSGLFFRCEQIPLATPPLHGSFHQHNTKSIGSDLQHTETPLLVNLYSEDDIMQKPNNNSDSNVDTSLHL